MKQNDKWMVVLYIVTMTVAYTPRYGNYYVSFRVQMLLALIWIAIGLLKLAANGFRFKSVEATDSGFFLKLYLTPQIGIHLYTIGLMVLGYVDWKYLGTNASAYVPTLLATLSIYLFGTKALRYNCAAVVAAWFISVTSSLMMKGPGIIWDAIYQAYINLDANIESNYLELHDLVLAIGYLICFYFISKEKWTKRNVWYALMAVAIMVLGMKRVSVAAIVVVVAFHFVVKCFVPRRQYMTCLICGVIGLILCYMVVYLLGSSSWFFEFMDKLGINMKGRNYYYTDVLALSRFSPTYLGIGRNVISDMLQNELSYLRVGGVHSDIIKMYVENGFVVFGIWLWYYLITVPRMYKKRFGYRASVMYFTLVIYTFILYLSDNIEIYFNCQILSILLPAYYAMKHREPTPAKPALYGCREDRLGEK